MEVLMLVPQQLVNGQLIITTIAKYSITGNSSSYEPKFEPCFDFYGQLISIVNEMPKKLSYHFDYYGQGIC